MEKRIYQRNKRVIDFILKAGIPGISRIMCNKVYDEDFFNEANKLKILSAEKVAETICEIFDFKTVFDIGCGMGLYISELAKMGKKCIGCDISPDGVKMASSETVVFLNDVTKPVLLNCKQDIVICFEVAEHIAKRYSKQLVRNCTSNGRLVLFTAAPQGQGGVGHINEQPYIFWINLFKNEGFTYDKELSRKIKEEMNSKDVVTWIADNFMVFNGPHE